MMQDLLYIPLIPGDEDAPGHPVTVWPWPDRKRPRRVWTLFSCQVEAEKPQLPIVPVARKNAFLESYVHDWDLQGDQFHYYSRFSGGGVWLLLEWEVDVDETMRHASAKYGNLLQRLA